MRMNQKALAAAAFAALFNGVSASALTLTTGVGDEYSLQDIIDAGGVWVGDKYFSDFSLTVAATTTINSPEASEVTVTGVEVDGNYGLKFNGGWIATPGEINNATLSFSVEVGANYPDYYITDAHLYVTAASSQGNGIVSISENIYNAPAPTGAEIGDLSYFEIGGDQSDFNVDGVDFEPVKKVWVIKDITVLDGTDPQDPGVGYAHLSEFYQTFSQIPEPGTAVLALLGTVAISSRRRRQA